MSFPIRISGFDIFEGIDLFYVNTSTYNYDYQVKVNDIQRFEVNNSYGNVTINKTEGQNINIKTEIVIRNNDEEYAEKLSEKIVEIREAKSYVGVNSNFGIARRDKDKIGSVNISYVIEIPNDIQVDITNIHGGIIVEEISSQLNIMNEHGYVELDSIYGDVNVDNSYGEISSNNIQGSLTISNSHGHIYLSNIKRNLIINSSYCSIEANDVGGKVNIINKHGKVSVKEVDGNVVIENSYALVEVSEIEGNLEVKNSHNPVMVSNIEGDVDVVNSYAVIEVDDANKGIDIKNKNGDIRYETKEVVQNNVYIYNEYGGITINIPKTQEGDFDAYVKHGEIYSDFNLELDKDTIERRLNGKIGDNDVTFKLETRNGDLKINTN